jgi:hypothetical protein
MTAVKGRTGNPGQKNPKKKNTTSFTVEPGKEARTVKPMSFRPTISLEEKINAAIASSGMNKTEWLEAAAIAYLAQNFVDLGENESKTEITDE